MPEIAPIDIKLDGHTLELFLASGAPAKFIQGPVRSGKTTAAIRALQVNALMIQPPNKDGVRRRKTVVVRNTYKQLIDTVIPSVREVMPENIWGPISTSGRPRRMIRLPGVEWEWLFYAADKADDVQDFKSLEASDIWLSEYRYIPREIVMVAPERVGHFPPKSAEGCWGGQVLGETNAPMEDHWSAIMSGQQPVPEGLSSGDKLALQKPAGWEFFIQPPGLIELKDGDRVVGYHQNPAAENVPNLNDPWFYQNTYGGKNEQELRTDYLNKPGRARAGKPVWPAFSERLHVAAQDLEAVPGHPIVVGQDFGRTPATVFGQYVGGQWLILDEFWAENVGAVDYADRLKPFMATRFPGFKFAMFGDPAGEQKSQSDDSTPMLMFRARGLRILPAPTNDVTVRLNAVDQLFRRLEDGGPAISISPRCAALIAAVGGGYMYRRMQMAGEHYSDVPDKGRHSHIADALQYLVIGGGEGRALLTSIGAENRAAIRQPGGFSAPRPTHRPGARIGGQGWGGLNRRR